MVLVSFDQLTPYRSSGVGPNSLTSRGSLTTGGSALGSFFGSSFLGSSFFFGSSFLASFFGSFLSLGASFLGSSFFASFGGAMEMSHTRIVRSWLTDTTVLLSPANTTPVTPSSWPLRSVTAFRPGTSQILIRLSAPDEASTLPSGEKARAYTDPPWVPRLFTSLPSAGFHRRTLLSWVPDPDASCLPSGLQATTSTMSVCPLISGPGLPSATFHRRIVLSRLQVARVL